jgi:hypothetical protein
MTLHRLVAVALALLAAPFTSAQTSVGVSIGIYQPGVYGRIDIGNQPPPPVVFAKPVVAIPPPVVRAEPPLYLYVPPGHQKHWSKHCASYNACGRPVYFVQESWIRERYEEHGHGHDGDGKPGKGHHGHGHD